MTAAVVTVVGGSLIWFFTLTERDDFQQVWLAQPAATRSFLQDTVSPVPVIDSQLASRS